MPIHKDRRSFLTRAAVAALAVPALGLAPPGSRRGRRTRDERHPAGNPAGAGGPIVISSGNGQRAVARALELLHRGADPLDAIVAGVKIIEDDPNDMTVGLGGLPNEEGVVELDSCVMHGPMARSGAVGALRNIKNPAAVAREVARRTDHCLLVGAGALKFAKRLGFKEENLLTDKAREVWLKWRATLNRDDDWLQEDEFDIPTVKRGAQLPLREHPNTSAPRSSEPRAQARGLAHRPFRDHVNWIDGVPYTTGTIHCSALTASADLAGCTTTSGLSWKLPGRVGDSPIIGAGCFTDNAIGSAGSTGRGEAVIQICGAHTVVTRMDSGDSPTDACLYALKKIADYTKPARLLDESGRPNFQVLFYALRKDGAYGSACMWGKRKFAVADRAQGTRLEDCASLYER